MKNYRKIMQELEWHQLLSFAASALSVAETSPPVSTESELAKLPREKIIDLVMRYAEEEFAMAWEMSNEDAEASPDEDDEDFFDHEDPDKD